MQRISPIFMLVISNLQKHNIERSKAMQAELQKVGIYVNQSGREYISKYLDDVLKDSTNISKVETRSYIAKELPGKPVVSDAGYDADDCIININKHPSIDGIYEIEYRIPARTYGPDGDLVIIPNQYKSIAYPKTVYDPAIISDEQMKQWGREAMESGIVNGREIMGNTSNGLIFKGYIDETTGEITNFYPVLEE